MILATEILSWVFITTGCFFCLIGMIGLLRLPEFYSRMHAAGIIDTMGASLVLIGLMLYAYAGQADSLLIILKLGFILFFLLVTSPTAGHALMNAAYSSGLEPLLESQQDEEHQ